jgi:hypothetical protein
MMIEGSDLSSVGTLADVPRKITLKLTLISL